MASVTGLSVLKTKYTAKSLTFHLYKFAVHLTASLTFNCSPVAACVSARFLLLCSVPR